MQKIEDVKKVDYSLVGTLIVTAFALAGIVYLMKKSGVKVLKDVASTVQ